MVKNLPLNLYRFRKSIKEVEPVKTKPEPRPIRDAVTDEVLLPYVGMEDDLRTLGLI